MIRSASSCKSCLFWEYAGPAAMVSSRAATNNFIRISIRPLSIHRESVMAIHLITALVFLGADGSFLAVADGVDAVPCDSLVHQVFFHRVCSPVAQTKVVFRASTLVAVTGDCESDIGTAFEKVGIRLDY